MATIPGAVPVELTATQYVILSENQRKKKALADTKDAYNQLLAENESLLQQLEDANKESYQVTEHFRQEVLVRNQRILELQMQMEQLRADTDEQLHMFKDQAAAREQELQDGMETMATELSGQVASLQSELDSVLDFKQRKAESEAALAALREEAVGLREALEAQQAQLERHYAGLHSKMRKEYEQKLEELKRSQEEELEERLDAGVRRILGANRRMAEELRLHITESDALQSELKLLQAERSNLAREVSLKQELEAGWAQRAGQQAAALKEAQAKVTTLEKSLQQVLADFAKERAGVVAQATAQVNAAGSEVDALRRLLRLKGRELQQLRRLAQEVLLQRSEAEIFLLSSLHQVRLAIIEEQKAADSSKHEAGSSSSSTIINHTDIHGTAASIAPVGAAHAGHPTSSDASSRSMPALAGDAKAAVPAEQETELKVAAADESSLVDVEANSSLADIQKLSWSEREAVLRMLMSKLHGSSGRQQLSVEAGRGLRQQDDPRPAGKFA